MLGILSNCHRSSTTTRADTTHFQSRLTAGVDDVDVEFGLVKSYANTLIPADDLKPPPGNYTRGTMIVGMLRNLESSVAYEIYLTNSTGNIPLLWNNYDDNRQTPSYRAKSSGMCLYRWVTSDFQRYTGGECVLFLPSDGLGDVKTITRDDDTGIYYMLYWGPPQPNRILGGTPYLFTSSDHGKSWQGPQLTSGLDHYNPPNTTIHAKDDLNLIYQPNIGLVDLQLFWEKNVTIPGGPGVYCDNGGCTKRRILGTMLSIDGRNWNFTGSTRIPGADVNDPPELQFYRSRPFFVPGTKSTRVMAHTLLYAPSPWINDAYGRHGQNGENACGDPPNEHLCHGPHMYEEWWVLGTGLSGLDISNRSWHRPSRFTKMAPNNAYLFAQPGLAVGKGVGSHYLDMVWVGSGNVYTLPLHRAVGLWAPANARVRVHPTLDLSQASNTTQLWLNADVRWGPRLLQGGCDETCAAYVLVELEDESTGKVIEGFDRTSFNSIMDQNAIDLPLRWNNSSRLPKLANVTVKIWFRSSKIYGVYAGDTFEPGY
eukprot:UC4_evm1s1052